MWDISQFIEEELQMKKLKLTKALYNLNNEQYIITF